VRPPRRRTVVVLAVAGAATVVAVLVAIPGLTRVGLSGPGSVVAPAFLSTYTVVYSGRDGLTVLPLDGHRGRYVLTTPTGPPLSASGGVAFVSEGMAYFLSSPYTSTPSPLVPAERVFPMVWPGLVGVERSPGSGPISAEFVNLGSPDAPAAPLWQFPRGYQPVAQFLASGPEGALRSWGAGTSGPVVLGPTLGHAAAVLGDDGSVVAWLGASGCATDGECPLHVSDTDSPQARADRVIPPLPGHTGYLPGGALSPDGSQLAVFVAGSGRHRSEVELALVDTTTWQVTPVGDSLVPDRGSTATAKWTPDSSIVLFSGSTGQMHAFQLGDLKATTVGIKGSDSFVVVQSPAETAGPPGVK
jgi:hypothetical protein